MSDSTYTLPERRGFMFVLSSPSGAGKTTLSRRLLEHHDGLKLSISLTTRPMRKGEVDEEDYFFIDEAGFDAHIKNGEMLEYADVFDYRYGTRKAYVNAALDKGNDVLFDIDWQGTRQLAEKCRDDLVSVFILPPSMEELERRLRGRGRDSDDIIAKRMDKAAAEISHWEEYDYVVVNRDVEETLGQIVHILEAERKKRIRQNHLPAFVEQLCDGK